MNSTEVPGTDLGQVTETGIDLKTETEDVSLGRDPESGTGTGRGREGGRDHGTERGRGGGADREKETTGGQKMIGEEADPKKENPRSMVGDPPQVTDPLTMFCT